MTSISEFKILKAPAKKNYITIAFTIIWLIVFSLKFKYINAALLKSDLNSIVICSAVYLFTIYLIYQLIWGLFGESVFSISEDKLVVKSGIYVIKRTMIYDLNKISNVRITSTNSSTYWGFQGIRFYDYKVTVLCFNYNKEEVTLGKNLGPFDFEKLKTWLS